MESVHPWMNIPLGDKFHPCGPGVKLRMLFCSSAAVAVLITLENWSRWSMVEPEVQLTCGKSTGSLPGTVRPGFSEMALFEKGVRINRFIQVHEYHRNLRTKRKMHLCMQDDQIGPKIVGIAPADMARYFLPTKIF
jgi:hypothetical protein